MIFDLFDCSILLSMFKNAIVSFDYTKQNCESVVSLTMKGVDFYKMYMQYPMFKQL